MLPKSDLDVQQTGPGFRFVPTPATKEKGNVTLIPSSNPDQGLPPINETDPSPAEQDLPPAGELPQEQLSSRLSVLYKISFSSPNV